jgi:hypothetical protein
METVRILHQGDEEKAGFRCERRTYAG